MTAVTAPAPKFEIGGILKRSFGVIGGNLPTLLLLALLGAAVPQAGLDYVQTHLTPTWARTPAGEFGWKLIFSLAAPVALAFGHVCMVNATSLALKGGRPGFAEILAPSARLLVPAIFMSLCTFVVTFMGACLFLIPGVILLLSWSVALPALVVEEDGVFEAIKRSWTLTGGRRGAVLGLGLIAIVIAVCIVAPAGVVLTLLNQGQNSPLYIVVFAVLSGSIALGSDVGATVLFYELRKLREGVDVGGVEATFD